MLTLQFLLMLLALAVHGPEAKPLPERELSDIKTLLAPLDDLMDILDDILSCRAPTLEMLTRTNDVMKKLSANQRKTIAELPELRDYESMREQFLLDFDQTSKQDRKDFVASMRERVIGYQRNKYRRSPCADGNVIDLASFNDNPKNIASVATIKEAFRPVMRIFSALNNTTECKLPSPKKIEEAHQIMSSLESEQKRLISDSFELKDFNLFRTFILMDWEETKIKLDPKLFSLSSIDRVMMNRVENYQIKKFGFSPCSNLSKAPRIEDLDGDIIGQESKTISESIRRFSGEMSQIRPEVSAIKVF